MHWNNGTWIYISLLRFDVCYGNLASHSWVWPIRKWKSLLQNIKFNFGATATCTSTTDSREWVILSTSAPSHITATRCCSYCYYSLLHSVGQFLVCLFNNSNMLFSKIDIFEPFLGHTLVLILLINESFFIYNQQRHRFVLTICFWSIPRMMWCTIHLASRSINNKNKKYNPNLTRFKFNPYMILRWQRASFMERVASHHNGPMWVTDVVIIFSKPLFTY